MSAHPPTIPHQWAELLFVIPYRRKIRRGIKFGGLADLERHRQNKFLNHAHDKMVWAQAQFLLKRAHDGDRASSAQIQ